jgi:hypothetical protein
VATDPKHWLLAVGLCKNQKEIFLQICKIQWHMVNVPISKWTKRKTVFRYETKGRLKPSSANITSCKSISMVAGYGPSRPWEDICFLQNQRTGGQNNFCWGREGWHW